MFKSCNSFLNIEQKKLKKLCLYVYRVNARTADKTFWVKLSE